MSLSCYLSEALLQVGLGFGHHTSVQSIIFRIVFFSKQLNGQILLTITIIKMFLFL